MTYEDANDVGESPAKRPEADLNDGSSRARRKNLFTHRSLMQRFIPFAEEEQRRERRSSSRASLPFMPTPPSTPVLGMYSATAVPLRPEQRPIAAHRVLDPDDELDLSSDEDDMLTANESSDSSSDAWSYNTATCTVDLSCKLAEIPAAPRPAPLPPAPLAEEEPMDISQEDSASVEPEPMRLGSFPGLVPKPENAAIVPQRYGNFQGIVPRLEHPEIVPQRYGNFQGLVPKLKNVEIFAQRDSFSESSDEEIARVFEGGSDSDSLYSWNSNSSNGRVNRPGRHADSVLENLPYYLNNNTLPSPYADLQARLMAPHAPAQAPSSYAQHQPQVPVSLQPYVHGVQPLPTQPQAPSMAYAQPQPLQPELSCGALPLDLAVHQSSYNLRKTPRTPTARINYQETRPRRRPERPFEAPYHMQELSQLDYRRQQRRLRISRRLVTQFASTERTTHSSLYKANDPALDSRKSCGCSCSCAASKILPVPVNSFAIERFLQEAQLNAGASSGQATSYLLIPTSYPVDMQARTNWAPPAYVP